MDSLSAFVKGQLNKHRPIMVFDWVKAAELIRDRKPTKASAGLKSDWEWTGGLILVDGKPLAERDGTYLTSTWAVPEIDLDGEVIECWRYQSEESGWESDTFWPPEALAILNA